MDVTWIVLNNKDKKDYDTDGHENNGVKYKSLIICTVGKCEEKIALKCLRRNYCHVKDTLMQISKASNIFVLIWKQRVEDFTLKHLLLLEIYAREICEKFVYKYSEE